MTIASEISRLQTAKANMKTAIVNKGVSVADSVSLSNYCDCINAISSGSTNYVVDAMLVGGGGGGGGDNGSYTGGGGGAGGVIMGQFATCSTTIPVVVGTQGARGTSGSSATNGGNGGSSCITLTRKLDGSGSGLSFTVIAPGGGGGGALCRAGNDGGSGGGAALAYCYQSGGMACGLGTSIGNVPLPAPLGSSGGGYHGSNYCHCPIGGGGGGARGSGMSNEYFSCFCCSNTSKPGAGGLGLCDEWGGKIYTFAGGGGGGTYCAVNGWIGKGTCGGGDGGCSNYSGSTYCCNGCDATSCGSGGGGGGHYSSTKCGRGGLGGCGLVIIGYNCVDKSVSGFTCATGGSSCYSCGNYRYHCFTSNGTFTIVS